MQGGEREDGLLRLEHSVAQQLADAEDIDLALQGVMQALCESEGWEYARYWRVDEPAGVLRFATSWCVPGSTVAEFMAASERTVFKPGVGLAGRVWESGRPLWVSDLSREDGEMNAVLAPGLHLHGACLFPVSTRGRVMGVMSFVTRRVREPDARLLESFRVIGIQVGQFLQRKQREEEIVGLNAELEERVRRRTAQLEAAHGELEAFSYAIAHDLRSPLTSIDGFSRLLEESGLGQEGEKGRHYLRRIRAGVRQMSDLTEAMLSLARLSRVELEHQEIDLAALARATLQKLKENDPGRPLHAELPDHLWVLGDSRLLTQLVVHLLNNAWKFSAGKPGVWISVSSEKDAAGETVYSVADRGAGFDMAHASRLFGAFQRLHARNEFEGTGIGLALVQKIVSAHGGRVWAEAKLGEGAKFSFTLG